MQFTVLDEHYEGNSSQIPVVERQTVAKYRLGNMSNFEEMLVFAEELSHSKIGNYFSDLQRTILVNTLQGSRKAYDQIAEECGYSPKYIKQDIAPKLWQLLSQALEQKITKSNVRAILELFLVPILNFSEQNGIFFGSRFHT